MFNSKLAKKIRHFIKYHNAFILILVFVIGFGSAIFASPEIRENVIGQKIVEELGTDNSFLLAVDLDNFDLNMKISDILEDDKYYYVHYEHKVIVIENSIWQEKIKQDVLRIEKESDRYQDLGLYIVEQLSQVAERWTRVLKTAQEEARRKGLTQKIEVTRYSGLIGRFVDTKERKIPGYQPIIPLAEKQPKKPIKTARQDFSDSFGHEIIIKDENDILKEKLVEPELSEQEKLAQMIEKILREKYGFKPLEKEPLATTTPISDEPGEISDVCSADNLHLCLTEEECLNAGGFWHSQSCNTEGQEIIEEPEDPEDTADPEDAEDSEDPEDQEDTEVAEEESEDTQESDE